MPLQLADIGNWALDEGLDPEGAMATMAIAQTEGALNGQAGDNGQSHGPFQFYSGGQLQNFAQDLGVSVPEAAQIATTEPDLAVRWALSPRGAYGWKHNGYLGDTLRSGQRQGLHGAELAQYGQHYGQVSVSPERAAQNYAALWGDYSPTLLDDPAQQTMASITPSSSIAPSSAPVRAERPSQYGFGLSKAEADALCGPTAALTFAAVYGRYPTFEEARDLAANSGAWDSLHGMHGPSSMQTYLGTLSGQPIHLNDQVDWSGLQTRVHSGQPEMLSTPGHYFYVDDFDPTAGTYHVGTSGSDLIGGTDWMTPDDMTSRMGPFNGELYADSTTSPLSAGGATSWP